VWTSRGPNPPKWPVVPGSSGFFFLSDNPLVVSSSLTPGAGVSPPDLYKAW